ncbi:GH-E family nuclease [Alteromonas sp. a30]|uniref:GH-E family nuclease n=1 Tax=Alteromonas sp. a30 TaxID=2730917 RepID=UPI002280827C|nr:GH-E family nuclease [Alteromonas sp. a30]
MKYWNQVFLALFLLSVSATSFQASAVVPFVAKKVAKKAVKSKAAKAVAKKAGKQIKNKVKKGGKSIAQKASKTLKNKNKAKLAAKNTPRKADVAKKQLAKKQLAQRSQQASKNASKLTQAERKAALKIINKKCKNLSKSQCNKLVKQTLDARVASTPSVPSNTATKSAAKTASKTGARPKGTQVAAAGDGFNASGSASATGQLGGSGSAATSSKVVSNPNVSIKVTKRPSSFRKKTIKDSWDNADNGKAPGTKKCPTCGKDVAGNPHLGEKRNGDDGWDNDHNPKWKDRDLTNMNRKQVLDEYNADTRLRCPKCNRSDN